MARTREQSRIYYLKNKDAYLKKAKLWALNNPERKKEIEKKCLRKNPEKYKILNLDSTLQRKYGISLEEYLLLLEKQEDKCKICRKMCSNGRRLAVDHCHETNKIRGLLCSRCNTSIGKFEHSESLLQTAIKYLKETK